MDPEEKQIRTLLRLLPEKGVEHRSIIRDRLLEFGETAIPYLREAAGGAAPGADQALEILEELRLRGLGERIAACAAEGGLDLEKGAWLLSLVKYPELSSEGIRSELDRLAAQLLVRIRGLSDPLKIIGAVQRYLYEEEGFYGNRQDYYDPDNSFINRVLERRLGIPISLAAVVLLVGRRIGLPFYGIGAPGHFLLRFGEGEEGILVDPFQNATPIGRSAVIRSLESAGHRFDASHWEAADDPSIVARMIRNLIAVYRRRGEEQTVRHLVAFHTGIIQGSSST